MQVSVERTSWVGLVQIQAKGAKYDNVQVEMKN